MFKLTDEQIVEIIELYGGDKDLITEVERTLNKLAIIDNEEVYYEVICSVAAQVETLELKAKQDRKGAADYVLDYVIQAELNRIFNNFEDAKESTKEKLTGYFK